MSWGSGGNIWEESNLTGLGDDFSWADALKTVGALGTTALQVYNTSQQIDAQQAMAARGIFPVSYSNGVPIYGASPPPTGVTPMVAPGVYNPYTSQLSPLGYPSGQPAPGYTYIAAGPDLMTQIQPWLPALAIGGGALLLIVLLK